MAVRDTCLYCGGPLVPTDAWKKGSKSCPSCSSDLFIVKPQDSEYVMVRKPDPYLMTKGVPHRGG